MKIASRRSIQFSFFWAASLLAAGAQAWTTTPADASFVNQEGLTIPAKYFRPAGGGPFPAVVMLHGCSGIYSNSTPSAGVAKTFREWADRLVGEGFAVLLVDSFTPRGTQNECGNGAGGVSEVAQRPLDALAGYQYLMAKPEIRADKVGLLGWSHGGSSTLATLSATAFLQPFKLGVAFYPGCGLYSAFGGLSNSTYQPYAPTVILHGTADDLYNSGACQQRVARAKALGASDAAGNPIELVAYSGAQHSFDQAYQVGSRFTQLDVDAKAAADPLVVSLFKSYLE